MEDNEDLLQKLIALREQAETAEFVETLRIASPFADGKTTLFQVTNSKLNTYFVLATTKVDALAILEREGHVVSRKLARIKKADGIGWDSSMQKFFSAAGHASTKKAQGTVVNHDGFAVMKRTGHVFLPLSVVPD